jgi:hypothetical protein
MIKNFEEHTKPLTKRERKLLPLLLKGFTYYVGADNCVKSVEIEKRLMDKREVKITGVTIRKLTSFIRRHSLAPICASSKGYFTAGNSKEIVDQIKSLKQRSDALLADAEGLQKILEQRRELQKQNQIEYEKAGQQKAEVQG